MTGRNIKLHLPPLLLSEIIESQDWYKGEKKEDLSFFSNQINTLVFNAMVYGSYPEAIITIQKEQYLINLVNDYLLKDILNLSLVKNPDIIHRLLSLLALHAGSVVSVNELANNLNIARVTVDRYLHS